MAKEFCDQWAVARADHQPVPETHPFIRKIADAGFRLRTWMAFPKYLERCRNEGRFPDPSGIITALLPRAATRGIVSAVLG